MKRIFLRIRAFSGRWPALRRRAPDPVLLPASAPQDGLPPESLEYLQFQAKRRRRMEFAAALILMLFVVLSTWSLMRSFGTDSWMYLALINFNFVLMVLVLFLVGRNVVKLVLERRKRLFGARLRTRLLLAFISVSLLPVLAMFLAANRVLNASVDYWFRSQVENSMVAALDVGRSFYQTAAQRLHGNASLLLEELGKTPPQSPEAEGLLWRWRRESGLTLAGFLERHAGTPPDYVESDWHIDPGFAPIWREARNSMNWDNVSLTGFDSLLWTTPSSDFVICALAVPKQDNLYLVTAESIGRGFLVKLDSIADGFEEYSRLKSLKRPLKISFSLVLGLLSLTVLFGVVWLSFRLSRQLLEPILALAQGTDQVARGQLDFQVRDAGRDELGQLVASFNRMAHEVSESHASLSRANALLEERGRVLGERNVYIETVLDNIATGVVTLDPDGRIATMNKAAAAMFSTSAALWQGRSPASLLQPAYADIFRDMFDFLRRHPSRVWQRELEFLWRGRNWRLVVHAVAMPLADSPEGRAGPESAPHTAADPPSAADKPEFGSVVAVIEDITELARMQRLAAWREVAKRIAHEIKNPLTPIKLSAQRLERKFGERLEDKAFRECTGLIVRETDRLLDMVGEFSAFASLPEVVPLKGNLAPIAAGVVDMFRASHREIRWELRLSAAEDAMPEIRMDPEALHRALMNVLKNAAEALEGIKGGDKRVLVSLTPDETTQTLVLEVEDNGPGLAGEDAGRMFEPYFSRKGGGTGLGLTIVRSVLHDHGAQVSARSPAGGGVTIRMEFPLAIENLNTSV